jgi:hypothetical protein
MFNFYLKGNRKIFPTLHFSSKCFVDVFVNASDCVNGIKCSNCCRYQVTRRVLSPG